MRDHSSFYSMSEPGGATLICRESIACARMAAMKRRTFLQSSLLASGSLLLSRSTFAQMGANSDSTAVSVQLEIDPSKTGRTIRPDFTGLSYEQAQLANPTYFSGHNTQLAGFLRTLGKEGVLRIGGNTSEYTFWDRNARPTAASMRIAAGPDTGQHPAARQIITPDAIRNLKDFLDLCGWKLIYGLNLGQGKPENAADEAAFVMETIGADRLVAFQLGNEPDLFHKNGLRPESYDFDQYSQDWQKFFEAIRGRVPNAPFAGPDTAFNTEWLVPFARKFQQDIKFISSHYYAEGPPSDPNMTIERLMRPNPRLQQELSGLKSVEQETHIPFRLTETNSCYGGGKQGVSDTFASSLWAGDLMYLQATAGSVGINFHGGGYGWYTPVAGTPENGFLARPEYYGLLLFAQAGAGQLVAANLKNNAAAPLLTAYGVKGDNGRLSVALFNKNLDKDVEVEITVAGQGSAATLMRLEAPRADDTTDVTLAGAPVGASGAWQPLLTERVSMRNGSGVVKMRRASGALLQFA
jgi:hypothetical protein